MVEVSKESITVKINSASPSEDLLEIQRALLCAVEAVHDLELRAVLIHLLEASLLNSSQMNKGV